MAFDSQTPAMARRRQSVALPKRRYHLSLALIVLILLIGTPLLWATFFGDNEDAEPSGAVSVIPAETDTALSPLDQDGETLPDLLADTVPVGENPTDAIPDVDALGNPVTPERRSEQDTQAPEPKTIILPDPLPPAPPLDPSLTRNSDFGPIPSPNAAGLTPLEAYRAKLSSNGQGQSVSIIIGGLGINPTLTQRAIDELPPAVSLSFAAHAPGLQGWIDRARTRGHEVLLELPMEGERLNLNEAGADRTLRVDNPAAENRRHLHYLLSRAQGYAAVINYQGQRLATRSDAIGPILTELDASGLGLLMDGSFEAPSLGTLAQSIDLPYAQGFGLIDPEADPVIIRDRLDALSVEAEGGTTPIGVGFVFPETLDAIKGWAAGLSENDLILVPATAALQ